MGGGSKKAKKFKLIFLFFEWALVGIRDETGILITRVIYWVISEKRTRVISTKTWVFASISNM